MQTAAEQNISVHIVVAYVVVAYVVMAYVVTAYVAMAYVVMTYMVMVYVVLGNLGLAYLAADTAAHVVRPVFTGHLFFSKKARVFF